MIINSEILRNMGVNSENADKFGPLFTQELPKYGIEDLLRQSHFLAQILHESGMCRYTQEGLNYSAEALKSVFGKYFPNDDIANEYARQPEKIASRVYANRMGNGDEASGDGYRYCGRGFIQLTGKDNYSKFSEWSGEDVLDKPERVAEEFPLLSSLFFWDTHNLNSYADNDDIKGITKRVNGGYNGLEERTQLLNLAKQLLNTTEEKSTDNLYRVSAANGLNLRSSPQITDNIIQSLAYGTQVHLLEPENSDGWVRIKVSIKGSEGYVAARYLSPK